MEFYARYLILNEMALSDIEYEKTLTRLAGKYEYSAEDITSIIDYYKSNPENWVTIVQKTRARVKDLRSAYHETGRQAE